MGRKRARDQVRGKEWERINRTRDKFTVVIYTLIIINSGSCLCGVCVFARECLALIKILFGQFHVYMDVVAGPISTLNGNSHTQNTREKKFCDKLLFTWNRFGFKIERAWKLAMNASKRARELAHAHTRLYALFDGKHQITRKNQESHPIDGLPHFYANTKTETRVNQLATEISLSLHLSRTHRPLVEQNRFHAQ